MSQIEKQPLTSINQAMDQQSAMAMGQTLVVPTVYMTGGGLVEAEPLTSNYKEIIEDQLIQDVESGGQACGRELGCQEHNADLNQCTEKNYREFLSIKERKKVGTAANNDNVEEDASLPALPLAPETTTELQVTKSTEFKDRKNTLTKEYSTRSRQRGMMVMFSYSEFETGKEPRDIVSDRKMVIDLFSQLNFRPVSYTNFSRDATLEAMRELKPSGYDCLFIVVSSHGIKFKGKFDTEFTCSSGGGISVHEVVEIFNNLKRPDLAGVPKVFIFQMCRGSRSLCEHSAATDSATFSEDDRPAAAAARRERRFSDVLIAHSTVPGYESVRNFGDAEGSLYMKALCEVFAAHAHEHHVVDLFRLVDEALRSLDPSATAPFESWGFGNLYLHPGLFEDAEGNASEM